MFVIRACASGLRRIAPCSMPGSWMSSVKVPLPRMNRASSRRRTGRRRWPARRWEQSSGPLPAGPGGSSPSCSAAQRMDRMMFSYRYTGAAARTRPAGSARGGVTGSGPGGPRPVIIMPGVRNPHCTPWHSVKPCCTGSSWPSWARPSTVRTQYPSTMAASTVHDFTGVSSSQTTGPAVGRTQPQCEPVSRSSSRMKWISSSRGSTSRVWSVRHVDRDPHVSGPAGGPAGPGSADHGPAGPGPGRARCAAPGR